MALAQSGAQVGNGLLGFALYQRTHAQRQIGFALAQRCRPLEVADRGARIAARAAH